MQPMGYIYRYMDLANFKDKARRKKKPLIEFLQKLDDIVPHDMHELVAKVDATVWQDTNCTSCANCCKTMTPTFTNADIKRISAHLTMTTATFKEKWLKKEETGEWVNTTQPCQFLVDDKCSIYEVRPADCAEFPHHDKKPFDAYNETFINNVMHCPATFTLVDRLKKIVERDYEW